MVILINASQSVSFFTILGGLDARAMGIMLIGIAELVCFKGTLQLGIMLGDLVNTIYLQVIKDGHLMLEKAGAINVFSRFKVEQAFSFLTPLQSEILLDRRRLSRCMSIFCCIEGMYEWRVDANC